VEGSAVPICVPMTRDPAHRKPSQRVPLFGRERTSLCRLHSDESFPHLYVGVTNNVQRRVRHHKHHVFEGFTARYNIERLVWYQIFGDIRDAISREKQIKRWRREKKIQLIESINPRGRICLKNRESRSCLRTSNAEPSARTEVLGRDDKGKISPAEPAFSTRNSIHSVHLLPHGHASDEQDQQS
jgi:putative endonuclease